MSEARPPRLKRIRHMVGCILDPDHGAGCVRQQWAASDPEAPWNRDAEETWHYIPDGLNGETTTCDCHIGKDHGTERYGDI